MSQENQLQFTRYDVREATVLYHGDKYVASGTREEMDKFLANLIQVKVINIDTLSQPEEEADDKVESFYSKHKKWIDYVLEYDAFEDNQGRVWSYVPARGADLEQSSWECDDDPREPMKSSDEMRSLIIKSLMDFMEGENSDNKVKQIPNSAKSLYRDTFYGAHFDQINTILDSEEYEDNNGDLWIFVDSWGDVHWELDADVMGSMNSKKSLNEMCDFVTKELMKKNDDA